MQFVFYFYYMEIVWKRHSCERFFERLLIYGITYGEIEKNILHQKVKQEQNDGTIKTIFKILDYYFTVIKKETQKYIAVITVWEASQKEVELWKMNQ